VASSSSSNQSPDLRLCKIHHILHQFRYFSCCNYMYFLRCFAWPVHEYPLMSLSTFPWDALAVLSWCNPPDLDNLWELYCLSKWVERGTNLWEMLHWQSFWNSSHDQHELPG
jgi:hypothetical protein